MPNHVITIKKTVRGAKVTPPIQRLQPGDTVTFKAPGFEDGWIFFFDKALFGERHVTLATGPLAPQQNAPKGAYPYSPVVRRNGKDMVAEGNSTPVFVME